MIEIQGVSKRYKMGDQIIRALDDISLRIDEGDFVAIMGPSGSGKSTLMHVLGLLDVPDSGVYRLSGKIISELDETKLSDFRGDTIGFIFQQFNLLPRMTAEENVALPMVYRRDHIDYDHAGKLLDKVGLEQRKHHRPNELSGGQQQRVAIARSLVNNPRIILADEPTGNLDSKSEAEILALLEELNAQGFTIIMVTHEDDIGKRAKRLIRMRDGVIQSDERLRPISNSNSGKLDKASGFFDKPDPRTLFGSFMQHLRQGAKTLAANKVRTLLSMLGILIGVAAVVTMLALGRGAQDAITKQLSSLGSNLLMLSPGASRGAGGVMGQPGANATLDGGDLNAISRLSGVKRVSAAVRGSAQVTYANKNWSTTVRGVSTDYADMRASQPQSGRFFTESENRSRSRVAVIGVTVAKELFGEKNPLGELIKINKVNFQVIGVLPVKGANSWRDRDDEIVMPVYSAMYRLLGKTYYDAIDIEVASPDLIDQVQESALKLMQARKRLPPSLREGAFNVRNMADIQEALSSSTKVMTALLAAIASISLLVGGIGIMNIMLVSVTERTREIGLRKAIGASQKDILWQFIIESVALSLAGGTLGIALAFALTMAMTSIAGWSADITLASVLLASLFATGVGLIFGIYPAQKAAKLPPIQALRSD